jgi:hypothetical protein
MTKNLDALLKVGTNGSALEVRRKKQKHPTGWEPGIQLGKHGGTIVTEPMEAIPADWTKILEQLLPEGFDVSQYQIEGDTIEVRAWDGNIGNGEVKRFYYFKAKVKRAGVAEDVIDISDILAEAKKAKPKKVITTDNERAYFIQITDLQAGQADGDGIEGMVARALEIPELVAKDLANLKKAGTPATSIFVPITGDLVEGINGFYEMQTFSVSLDRREQTKLVRRLVSEILMSIASHGLPVHVAVVPGNHGENRQNGKAFTTLGDNDDVAVIEQIAEAFELSEKFSHVTFSFPADNRVSLTVEVLGHVVGLTHGHIARSAGTPTAKLVNWYKTMAGIKDPIGDSQILFVGHYHHLILSQAIGDMLLIMGGALCDASDWFSQSLGLVSDPCLAKGTITREKKIETFIPYFWDRTKIESKEV